MHVSMPIQPSDAAVSGETERCSTLGWRSNINININLPKPAMQRASDFAVVQFALPDGELWPVAVLLLDNQDRLHVRARAADDLAKKIPPEDAEVVALSLAQIAEDARTESGTNVLETLEDRLSNAIRISDRQKTHDNLDDLYRQYITLRT
jgi:hypothetical protein